MAYSARSFQVGLHDCTLVTIFFSGSFFSTNALSRLLFILFYFMKSKQCTTFFIEHVCFTPRWRQTRTRVLVRSCSLNLLISPSDQHANAILCQNANCSRLRPIPPLLGGNNRISLSIQFAVSPVHDTFDNFCQSEEKLSMTDTFVFWYNLTNKLFYCELSAWSQRQTRHPVGGPSTTEGDFRAMRFIVRKGPNNCIFFS